jgi:transcriptional regulator with XRE-family HTH domain
MVAVEPPLLEVRRRGALLGAVGVGAATVATAYLGRALDTGAALDWLLTVVLTAIALLFLGGLLDARTPLVVATAEQVRMRRGRRWTAVAAGDLTATELTPRSGLRDGRLRVVAGDEENQVPLGLGSRVVADGEPPVLLASLVGHADAAEDARDDEPVRPVGGATATGHGPAHWRDPRPALASGIAALADRLPTAGAAIVARLRGPGGSSDAEPAVDGALALAAVPAADDDTMALALPEDEQLRRGDDLDDLLACEHSDDEVIADVPAGEELTEAIVWPVAVPVLGPELTRARLLLGLSLDQLAERTRIPARVIEAVERDDFALCGGDFYARGHLRTLARVLGLAAAPLVEGYDELYADRPAAASAPIAARQASLPAREPAPPRQSPRWSVLVAAVMAVVLAWSVARLALDTPTPERVAGLGAGSGGVNGAGVSGRALPVLLRASGGGAHVVVRDGNGRIAFTGDLAFGESRRLDVVPPIRLDSSDGGVEVVVNGEEQGRVGDLGRAASEIYDGG